MNSILHIKQRAIFMIALMVVLILISDSLRADTGTCNGASITLPFTDVQASNTFFCSIASAYFSGLTNGTSATTFSPGNPVSREQMAAFVSRGLDQSLRRGNRRAALGQYWRTRSDAIALTTVGSFPVDVKSDGADLWVANLNSATVSRVRASDGRLLGTWTGADSGNNVLVARGRVYVTGATGSLYVINPALAAGEVTTLVSGLGNGLGPMAFDGSDIWIAHGNSGVTRVSFGPALPCIPVCTTSYTAGLSNVPGILYDGSNIWVTDRGDNTLKRLNSNGAVDLSVPVAVNAGEIVFDGTNIWVPHQIVSSVTVVRVKDAGGNPLAAPFVLASLTFNGLANPSAAAFDGERILVMNREGSSVSLWRATDLSPLGSTSLGTDSLPNGVCSDGLNFWIVLSLTDRLARF